MVRVSFLLDCREIKVFMQVGQTASGSASFLLAKRGERISKTVNYANVGDKKEKIC